MTTVDLACASEYLNLAAKLDPQRAREQLEGSVALHNILNKHKVAYLADEVGMGKTYVALGVLALFRHFQPDFRALVIAPRGNIQRKWIKETKNFIRSNIRFADLRVKGLDGRPVRELVSCDSLVRLASEAMVDPDRDFFMRMTTFSLALSKEDSSWAKVRDRLLAQLPWLDGDTLRLHGTDKTAFKDNYGRAMCAALPVFDLVIIDEGHNLKHGFTEHGAARNRMMAHVFGHPSTLTSDRGFKHAGPRAKRVLFLSATPVEERYEHLWNQLDVFGLADPYDLLKDPSATEEAKKALISSFLIRRVTSIRAGSVNVTKNQYRQEWRAGGMTTHDEPITIQDDRQKLTVALVQKKVSETLASLADDKFGMSFQVGMLASFESFQETALPKKVSEDDASESDATFDGADQTKSDLEKEGVDVRPVNKLAKDHRRTFGCEMAHPKMDALVEVLSRSWKTGRKGLVFVRRVASVKEIKRRLDDAYDTWLMERLRADVPPAVWTNIQGHFQRYQRAREEALDGGGALPIEDIVAPKEERTDKGGNDTFFAYFFRGEGRGELSGAAIARNLGRESSQFATLLRRNLVSEVLGTKPGAVFATLCNALGRPEEDLKADLALHARDFLGNQKRVTRGDRFHAAQAAAFEMLRKLDTNVGVTARAWWHLAFESARKSRAREGDIGDVLSVLEERTFWTEVDRFSALSARLFPSSTVEDPREAFLERERRCQLLAAGLRLGHSLLDLYVVIVRRAEQTKEQQGEDGRIQQQVIDDFLELLDTQRRLPAGDRWGAWAELSSLAEHFPLICDVNLDLLAETDVAGLPAYFGKVLGAQQPVGGMAGKVNKRLVAQFRMPGYPMALVTTDILQEGEDLHTFCSDVFHYGISWTPSSMEQRTGRIDRVRSATDRRVSCLEGPPAHQDRLHVFLPHLADTVEVLQVTRVLKRMDTFMRLMHEGLGKKLPSDRTVNVTRAILEQAEGVRLVVADDKPLRTAFPVNHALLSGQIKKLAVSSTAEADALARFASLAPALRQSHGVEWEPETDSRRLFGTARVDWGRIQPFVLLLQSHVGVVVVRCVSPVGRLLRAEDDDYWQEGMQVGVGLGAVDADFDGQTYDVTVEGDVSLWAKEHDSNRVSWLVERVVKAADRLERRYLPDKDRAMTEFHHQLKDETDHER